MPGVHNICAGYHHFAEVCTKGSGSRERFPVKNPRKNDPEWLKSKGL